MRKLVSNVSYSPHDACEFGRCPHCNEIIDGWRSAKNCQCCGEPITWTLGELPADERIALNNEARTQEKEYSKKIKPCPFCGKSVSFPAIQISKTEKPYLYLSVGCFACGIELTEISFKAEMESLEKANETLIKKWNMRWNGEPD